MIDTALRACGLTMEDIDLLGVTSGPGSFTGLRIGLVGGQGAGPAAADPLRGRFHHGRRWPMVCAGESTVIGAQDARRGQVYWGAFDLATHTRLTEDAAAPVNKFGKICTRLQKTAVFCWRWRNFVLQ